MPVLDEISGLIGGLASGAYPPFVKGGDLDSCVPVFLYHRVDPRQFEHHLSYLHKNEYGSVFADEHHVALTTDRELPERTVVLTFDDGLADLYEVAFPLLKKYGLKIIVFLIPAWIDAPGMITWDQVREMHDSGFVDFQSHSMHHAAIPISPRVVAFYHPNYAYSQAWNFPVDCHWNEGLLTFPPALGTPIFQHASRLGDAPRYIAHEDWARIHQTYVSEHGEREFFRSSFWQQKLQKLSHSSCPTTERMGRYETALEQRDAIRHELADSRDQIEHKLSGKRVRHFAYPWSEVGKIAKELLAECGYASAYAGLTGHQGKIYFNEGIYELARLNGDFVPCLPGSGRKSFFRVLAYKLGRRLSGGLQY